jgi:transposase
LRTSADRSRKIKVQSYLREVLTMLPTLTNKQIKDVTPAAWAKAQINAHQQQAT